MSNKSLTIIIVAVITIIIAVILFDFLGNQPGKRGANPYPYNMDVLKQLDSTLIHYAEVKNISLAGHLPRAFDLHDDILYLAGENYLQAIRPDGVQLFLETPADTAYSIEVNDSIIFVGYMDHIAKFDRTGKLIDRWQSLGKRAVITSLAIKEDKLYVADAGNRRVLIYDHHGRLLREFKGKSESDAGSGFVIPSPSFDIAVNHYGDLWVVNPGRHALENYTDDGEMRGYWTNGSKPVEGFVGCCNPAEIAVMEDASFVTSEKGMVWIKVYDESGKLLSIVAPPSKFKMEGRAPEVEVDSKGLIYALDFDRNTVRVFEKNKI